MKERPWWEASERGMNSWGWAIAVWALIAAFVGIVVYELARSVF